MLKRLFKYLYVMAALLCPAAFAHAQEPTAEQEISPRVKNAEQKNYLSLSYENDMIGSGKDEYYTSGVRASWFNVNTPIPNIVEEIADKVPLFDINDSTSTYYTIGQNLFTPRDITVEAQQYGDRPWAAFLYGSAGIVTVSGDHIDEFEMTLGVVGPEALGKQTQRFIHKMVDGRNPRGWKNQLGFEPGLILSAGRRWPRAFQYGFDDLWFRAEPNVVASVGNIYTYAESGISFSLTPYADRYQDMPPRVRPAMPGSGYFETPRDGWSWQIFAGANGRAVARNIFLDGNSFKDSYSVDKKPFVMDAVAGVAFTMGDARLAYSYNYRTKEFDGQANDAAFGSLTLTVKF